MKRFIGTHNQRVAGSSPAGPTNKIRVHSEQFDVLRTEFSRNAIANIQDSLFADNLFGAAKQLFYRSGMLPPRRALAGGFVVGMCADVEHPQAVGCHLVLEASNIHNPQSPF